MRIAFIGGGVMAEAILSRAIAQNVTVAADVVVSEPVEARRAQLAQRHAVTVAASNRDAARDASLVVLAVKPQHISHVYHDLGDQLSSAQTVLSIVAGVGIAKLSAGLNHPLIARAMPNTPAQVGAGVTVWTVSESVPAESRNVIASLLGSIGREIFVSDEVYLDMATAVSGSGPAYVFLFMEAMTEAGVHAGLPRDIAYSLVLDTVLGSAQLAKESGRHPGLLREMVTSPGGTTAEALRALERGGFRSALQEAVAAAHRKAQALGGGSA